MDPIERRVTGEPQERGARPGADRPVYREDAGAVDLRLRVVDPEVAAELRRRPAGEARDRYALEALRLGVLALRSASGAIDAAAVKEAGAAVVAEVRALLEGRAQEIARTLTETLGRYFDPKTGAVPRRLEDLVREGGEIDRALKAQVGAEGSALAETLRRHVGEGSRLLALLSPEHQDGVRAQVERLLSDSLREQREKICGEFSLDRKDSALSRLVGEIERAQGDLSVDLKARIEAVTNALTLDVEDSALNRLRRELRDLLAASDERNRAFQAEVREALKVLEARRAEAARTTTHGVAFDDALGEVLAAAAAGLGDIYERTATTTGAIRYCKKGDHVTTLGPETAAPGARIVWEAKADKTYKEADACAELAEARKNRAAQVGVFVFARSHAPAMSEPIRRIGSDILVAWDHEEPASDIMVRTAYSLARALCVAERKAADDSSEAAAAISRAVRRIEEEAKHLDDFRKKAETIVSHGKEIRDRAETMLVAIRKGIEEIDGQIGGRGAA